MQNTYIHTQVDRRIEREIFHTCFVCKNTCVHPTVQKRERGTENMTHTEKQQQNQRRQRQQYISSNTKKQQAISREQPRFEFY